MKANIFYIGGFNIPKKLPHAGPGEGVDTENWDWDIFNDEVSVFDHPTAERPCLRLCSNYGVTDIWEWVEYADHFKIPMNCRAWYEGARNALNAVHGIEFPECIVTNVESTLGRFETLEDYDKSRKLSLPVVRYVERFLKETHSSDAEISLSATIQLFSLKKALSRVIDMDDPCRNPIHSDESKVDLA